MKQKKLSFLKKGSIKLPKTEMTVTKRQRFVVAVLLLSLGLFFIEHQFGKSGFYISIFLSVLSVIFFALSMHKDLRENFTPNLLIMPFFFTLAFSLFYFLVPARFLSRILLTSIYAIGLYSLFLSLNIFTIASIRTIALLSSARTVSFIISLISYFFLSTVAFSLHIGIVPLALLVFFFSFFLVYQSIWTITLEKSIKKNLLWSLLLAVCLAEVSLMLWFWPSTPTLVALFLTGIFYTMVGLSHVWFEKRLFKGIIWEYVWVAVLVFCILILFTSWKA